MSRKKIKNNDEENFWDEPDQNTTSGSVVGGSEFEIPDLPDLLLELIADISKLKILMSEVDSRQYKVLENRYTTLLKLVDSLPRSKPPPTKLGFSGTDNQ